jgi:hypothetical protein
MKRRLSITLRLEPDGDYAALNLRLIYHGAEFVADNHFLVVSTLTPDELRRDLQQYVDPADGILVEHVALMSYRNIPSAERFGTGV